MDIRYEYTFADFRAFAETMYGSGILGKRWRLFGWLAAFMFLVACVALAVAPNLLKWDTHIAGVGLAAFGGLMVGTLGIIIPWQTRYYFRKQGLAGLPVQIEVADSGIRSMAGNVDSKMDWSAFIRADDAPGYCFLWINKMQGIVFPDRGFANASDRIEFRRIVERHMQDRVKWRSGSS